MSEFIKITDYDASIHREILDQLTREDQQIVEICEDRAIQEMEGYLSERYDIAKLFAPIAEGTPDTRNSLVLMMAIDIAIYHLFCIHNPMKISQIRKDRYDRAVDWLKEVSKGKINIQGAPTLSEDILAKKSQYQINSNVKRQTRY